MNLITQENYITWDSLLELPCFTVADQNQVAESGGNHFLIIT